MQDQLLELKYLKDAAENTSLALKDLLALKQQQAGVVEAREAVKQGEETLKQGRSIMLFTIVTIIFVRHSPLPLLRDVEKQADKNVASTVILHRSLWYEYHQSHRSDQHQRGRPLRLGRCL